MSPKKCRGNSQSAATCCISFLPPLEREEAPVPQARIPQRLLPRGLEPSLANLLHPPSLGMGLSPWSLVASCSGESPHPLHWFAPAYPSCFCSKSEMEHTEENTPGQNMM